MDDQSEPQPRMMAEELVPGEARRIGVVEQPRIGVVEEPRIGVVEQPRIGVVAEQPRIGVMAEQPAQMSQVDAAQPVGLTQRVPAQQADLTQEVQPGAVGHMLDQSSPLQPRLGMAAVAAQAPLQARSVDATPAVPLQQGQMMQRTAAVAATPAAANQSSGDSGGASAGSGFQVDPAQYQAAVSPILAAADQISQLATNLSGFLASMEANSPWGNDESGKHFAEGDKGYLKYSADTQKGLKGLPDGLHYIVDGLKAMADGYQNAEDSASGELAQQDARLQQDSVMPQSPSIPSGPTAPISPRYTLRDIARG